MGDDLGLFSVYRECANAFWLRIIRVRYHFLVFSLAIFLLTLAGVPQQLLGLFSQDRPVSLVRYAPAELKLEERAQRALALGRTEFLNISTHISTLPDVEGSERGSLRVREEYLVAAYGKELSSGFLRGWNVSEPIPLGPDGGVGLLPPVSIKVTEATRRWIAPELLGRWTPLSDMNDRLGLPPAEDLPKGVPSSQGIQTLRLGTQGVKLERGLYVYRIDYEVAGAVLRGEGDETFVFNVLQPMTLPVRSLEVLFDGIAPSADVFTQLVEQETSTQSMHFRQRAKGRAEGVVLSEIPGQVGVQVHVRWGKEKV